MAREATTGLGDNRRGDHPHSAMGTMCSHAASSRMVPGTNQQIGEATTFMWLDQDSWACLVLFVYSLVVVCIWIDPATLSLSSHDSPLMCLHRYLKLPSSLCPHSMSLLPCGKHLQIVIGDGAGPTFIFLSGHIYCANQNNLYHSPSAWPLRGCTSTSLHHGVCYVLLLVHHNQVFAWVQHTHSFLC